MNILIAGGKGLVGTELKSFLTRHGHDVFVLSRSSSNQAEKTWHWNPSKNEIDPKALVGQDVIINLAGARILPKPWTKKRRKELVSSRVGSTEFLVSEINKVDKEPSHYIQISAIGYYGNRESELLTEDSGVGKGFLPELCEAWEKAGSNLNAEVKNHILRLGLYMHKDGGYYPINALLAKFKLLTNFGNGKQYLAFTHKDQLNGVLLKLMSGELDPNTYNVVAKSAYRSREFVKLMGGPSWLPNIPGFLLKLIIKRTSEAFLSSTNVESKYKEVNECDSFDSLEQMIESLH
ncbi:MAG: NAD-dependent epimerase/dehydratase family protein [Bacteroidia bacterium]